MTDKVLQQILAIRDSGLTNIFDTQRVLEIAKQFNYYELILYIADDSARYCRFIMNGSED